MIWNLSKMEVFEFFGGRNPLFGGLHLTYDSHFRTRMSYSSQKSWVKIWVGLIEIGDMFILREGRNPLLRGVTCDLQCPFSNLAEIFQSEVLCENLVQIGWDFQELSCPQTKIKIKIKQNHRHSSKQYPSEFFFSIWIIITREAFKEHKP